MLCLKLDFIIYIIIKISCVTDKNICNISISLDFFLSYPCYFTHVVMCRLSLVLLELAHMVIK